jgi:hypothetical protein
MNTANTSFTPVRRRDPYVHDLWAESPGAKAWTSSRCHRLLRPLTSRIALLQKSTYKAAAIEVVRSTEGLIKCLVSRPSTQQLLPMDEALT